MPPLLGKLTFHRVANPTQPEAFVFERQRYARHEGDVPRGVAEFPWDEDLLGLLMRLQRDVGDADARRRVGAMLRDFLNAVGWNVAEQRLSSAVAEEGPSILTVSASAVELFALPWELALLPDGSCLGDHPGLLLRYEWPERYRRPAPEGAANKAPRIVVAWSGAGGVVPAAEHLRWIRDAIDCARIPGVELKKVDNVSSPALEAALAKESGPVVLHILCHGALHGAQGGTKFPALQWNKGPGGGDADAIDPDRLRTLIDPHRSKVRLVVLCACLGSENDPQNLHVGSLAQAVHRLGIPAVVASRAPLTTQGSVRLTRVLYRALLVEGASLEISLLRARAALRSGPGKADERDPGDSYGICVEDAYALQLYAPSTETISAKDGAAAWRVITATYPFAGPMAGGKSPERATLIAYLAALEKDIRQQPLALDHNGTALHLLEQVYVELRAADREGSGAAGRMLLDGGARPIEHFLARQANLWVCSGSGRRPRV